MNKSKTSRIITIFLCCLLIFQQTGFARVASVELNIAGHFASLRNTFSADKFRPLHLRYISFDNLNNNFKLLLDKGDSKNPSAGELESAAKDLFNYFLVGISLPNSTFWVNLRPDSPNDVIDPLLAQTEVGKILLEADLQLKKDTANATNPGTPEGKRYWDKLYKKAGELYGSENVTIPTLTRPWIVPDEIIIRESIDSAYVYKATLKVMLEQDYLKGNASYAFKDEREKQLNEYSAQIIRESIIPKLTKEINNAKCYAPLRQVYYSLILAQWFKARNKGVAEKGRAGLNLPYPMMDSRNLSNLKSKIPYSVNTYFNAYKESFEKGEYNIKESNYTPYGQVIRSYFSGGIANIAPEVPGFGEPVHVDSNGTSITVVPDHHQPGASSPVVGAAKRISIAGAVALASLISLSPEASNAQYAGNNQQPADRQEQVVDGVGRLDENELQLFVKAGKGDRDALGVLFSAALSKPNIKAALAYLNIEEFSKGANEGSVEDFDILRVLGGIYYNSAARDALVRLNPKKFVEKAEQGSLKHLNVLKYLAEFIQVFRDALKNLNPQKFAEMANHGRIDNIDILFYLDGWGNPFANQALQTLNYAEFARRANQGSANDAIILWRLIRYNPAVNNILSAVSPDEFAKQAGQGNKAALTTLRNLGEFNPAAIEALLTLIAQGNTGAVDELLHLAEYSPAAQNALKRLDLRKIIADAVKGSAVDELLHLKEYNPAAQDAPEILGLFKITADDIKSSKEAIAALYSLARRGIAPAMDALVNLTAQGNKLAAESFNAGVGYAVLQLRNAHLYDRISDSELEKMLDAFSLGNPFFLYACYTSPENFGDLVKMIFKKLSAQAKSKGKDLHSFLRELDPKGVYYQDFILQLANFSQLDDLLTTPQALYEVMDFLFMDSSRQTIENYSLRLALFVEAITGDKQFTLQREFQEHLRSLYGSTSGLNQYLIVSLLTVYAENLGFLNQEDLSRIRDRHGIKDDRVVIDYSKLLKDSKIVAHIVFADSDAASGFFGSTAELFQGREKAYPRINGYKVVSSDAKRITLEKGNVRVVLINASSGEYNLEDSLREADIISSRGHAGTALRAIFTAQSPQEGSEGKVFFISECRSATVIGPVSRMFPGAHIIGINEIGRGIESTIATYHLLEALQARVPNFQEVTEFIRPHLEQSINNFVLPGGRASNINKLIKSYLSAHGQAVSSPVTSATSSPIKAGENSLIGELASRKDVSINFSAQNQEYRLRIRKDSVSSDIGGDANPDYTVLAESRNQNETAYPVGAVTGISMDREGIVHLGWIFALDYPGILQEIERFRREQKGSISLIEAARRYTISGKNREYLMQIIFLYDSILSKLTEDAEARSFFSNAPRDLRRNGIGNAIAEFVASFIPAGGKIEFLLANQESIATLKVGGKFEDTLIGGWFKKLGFDAIYEAKVTSDGVSRYILEKERLPALQTQWNNPNEIGKYHAAVSSSPIQERQSISSPAKVEAESKRLRAERLLVDTELTDAPVPSRPVRLVLYHDTNPANAERIWRNGAFDPEVRSSHLIYNQPSGIYCSPEKLMRQEFHKTGIFPRIILELRANVKNPLDDMKRYEQLLEIARAEARKAGIDLGLANARPEFGKIFTSVLRAAGYDCVILRGEQGLILPIILDPTIIEIIGVKSHYQYEEAQRSDDFLKINMGGLDQPFINLPLPEWAKVRPGTLIGAAVGKPDTASSPVDKLETSYSPANTGGIDFRFLPIVTQSMDSLGKSIRAMPQVGLQRINLAQEWSDIERLVSSGITPSAERLKEYLAASCFKGNLDRDMEKIVSCISDILRMQEETCCVTDPTLKDILVVLGSGRSGEELKVAFKG